MCVYVLYVLWMLRFIISWIESEWIESEEKERKTEGASQNCQPSYRTTAVSSNSALLGYYYYYYGIMFIIITQFPISPMHD